MKHTHTILVIDDSTTFCEFIAQALEKVGYRVIAATDGHEGLIKVLQEHPVCVILDVILPGLSGFEVCRQLRAREPQQGIPIIMISAKNTPLDQMWGLRQGANRYVPKPFTEEVLVQAVTEVVSPTLRPKPTVPLRAVSTNSSHTDEQRTVQSLYKLIPRRKEDAVLMWSVNPLTGSVIIADKSARRTYAAIDGRKDVNELCFATGLDGSELIKALKFLLAEQRIELYDLEGQLVESAWLFNLR